MIKYIVSFLLLLLVGCSKTSTPNLAPIADIQVDKISLFVSETLHLNAQGSHDNDGEITTYQWSENNSSFSTAANATWVAPTTKGDYILTLLVIDDKGAKGRQSIQIEVKEILNNAPTAKILLSASNIFINDTLTLYGSQSSDSDGNISKYAWTDENNLSIGTSTNITWFAPNIAKTYRFTLTVTDDGGATDTSHAAVTVKERPIPQTPIAAIKSLISSRTARYICVGDSTRSGPLSPFDNPSPYDGQHLFDRVKATLDNYNVTSFLYARAGHEAKQFNMETNTTISPTWQDVVSIIPANGANTIVDISLGINDLFSPDNNYAGGVADIKKDLSEAIGKIKIAKPQTHFLLTMPNPKDPTVSSSVEQSLILSNTYLELSNELGIPLVDVQGAIAFDGSMFQQDIIHFHMIPTVQEQVADVVLNRILP